MLRKVTELFGEISQEYFVIGATARDIVCSQLVGTISNRGTRDLDIAIAIPNWTAYEQIEDILISNGFTKDADMRQRFRYGYYELDIVPYGDVANKDDMIIWPPAETIAMSVKGFNEVLKDVITLTIDDEFCIKIASLHGLFLLKFNAWMDRNLTTSKDAEDMSFILSNYFMANVDRNAYSEVFDWADFDEYAVGGYWIANDLVPLLNKKQIEYYKNCIDKELNKEESSLLFNQILENSHGLKYEQVRSAWMKISDVFRKESEGKQLVVKNWPPE